MDFRRRSRWTGVALGVVLAIGVPLTARCADSTRAATTEPYTPAKDAKDLKAVLFNWMWGMGMLKGHDERDMVATLEYQGKGTIQVDGQPCTLTTYRASTNYQTFSQRIRCAVHAADRTKISNVEVVSGLCAWNEDTPGAEIGPTKGKSRSDAGDRAGAADPHLGESSGARPRPRLPGQRRHSCWVPIQARFSTQRCREGAPDVRVVGSGQAGRDVSDSGRSRGDGDSHP